ncbi:BnaC06g27520D [Brassica napus]|uniref:RING-type E3 ubiquitin transferase n=1 Tax=Brassica napus TaxID=3708 RepID=A0A078HH85_BRANA|nr:BnaC06g27520D [Brassica napus]
MLVPYYIVGQKLRLKMVICMRRLEEEKEVEEDEAEEEKTHQDESFFLRLSPLPSKPSSHFSFLKIFSMESTNIVFFFSVSNLFSCFFYKSQLNVFVLLILTIVFSFSFVSSGQRELSDEFNTKLNLENQNEESDEKMHMEADYSSSSDSSSDDSDSEEEEGPMIPQPQPQPPRSTTTGGSRTLFAGNLALQVKKSDIKEFFREAGEVVDVKFGMGRDDGSFRGFGHILFASPVEAQMALGFQGRTLLGRQIRLDMALESSETRETASVDGYEVIPEARSGTLLDLDLLDCPVCCQALTQHVFQCDNGHIACSSCCLKLRNKCPVCALPIGNNRCRILERVFSYGKELAHEKECGFALCYCPAPNCNYAGVYKDLYTHYDAYHTDILSRFVCGTLHNPCMSTGSKISVLQEYGGGPLFGSTEMNRIQKVRFQTPQENFMSIPSYLNPQAIVQNLRICIRRLEEEDGEEEEEETVDDLLIRIRQLEEEEEAVEADDDNNVRRSTREKKANSKYQNKVK